MIRRQTQSLEDYQPVSGKTYSLFGQDTNTELFYRKLRDLTDEMLSQLSIPETKALEYIQSLSRNKRKLKMAAAKSEGYSALTDMLHYLDKEFTGNVSGLQKHLKEVPLHKLITDKELLASREQYLLYMVEFELVNRIHKKMFMDA